MSSKIRYSFESFLLSLFILTSLDIATLRMIGILNNQYIAKVEKRSKDYDLVSIEVFKCPINFCETFVSISMLGILMNEIVRHT